MIQLDVKEIFMAAILNFFHQKYINHSFYVGNIMTCKLNPLERGIEFPMILPIRKSSSDTIHIYLYGYMYTRDRTVKKITS